MTATQNDAGITPAIKALVAQEVRRQVTALERDVYLTGPEAAELASIKTDTLATYIRRGHGPRLVGSGKLRRFKQSDVVAWISTGMGRKSGDANAA